MNQGIKEELTFEQGAIDWYQNVYLKIAEAIENEHLLVEFPGQTEADMYMWLVRKWDEMKRLNEKATENDAAKAAKKEIKTPFLIRWGRYLKSLLSRN
jgi:hypothetical protein